MRFVFLFVSDLFLELQLVLRNTFVIIISELLLVLEYTYCFSTGLVEKVHFDIFSL